MMLATPTVEDERVAALRAAARGWEHEKAITADERAKIDARSAPRWRSNRLLPAIAFFLLTLLALTAVGLLLAALHFPKPGLIAGIAALAIAELLIARRFFGSGIESALWIGGLVAMITALPHSGAPEALLIFAAASVAAGARMRNAVFCGLAAVLVIAYAAVKSGSDWLPLIVAIAITLVAGAALQLEWKRPSAEWIWNVLLLVAPPAGYVAALAEAPQSTLLWAPLAITGTLLLFLALRTRARIVLVGAAFALALAGFDLFDLLQAAVEVKLIAAGVLLVGAGAALSRLLSGRTRGFVATPSHAFRYDEAVQIAGVIAVHPGPASTQPEGPHGGGGGFGGAGASGDY